MNLTRHPLVTSFGITTIILMSFVDVLISSLKAGLFYHWDGPAHVIIGAVLLVVLIVWITISLLLFSVRNHPLARRVVWALLSVIILRELLEAVYMVIGEMRYDAISFSVLYPPTPANIAFFAVVLLSFLSLSFRPARESPIWGQGKNLFMTVLGFAALSGLLTVYQLLQIGWIARNLNAPRPLRTPSASLASTSHPKRVIWLLLDELSYDQVYEHRFPGLQLPAFDSLAAQSSVFTNVIPAGMYTQEVLPSLIVGRSFDKVKYHTVGPLDLHPMGTGKSWVTFNPSDTVFQDAVDHGYRTGVAGWYNPYCRLLPEKLDSCYWDNTAPLSAGGLYGGGKDTLQITKDIFLYFLSIRSHQFRLHLVPPQGEWSPKNNILHLESYQKLVPQGDKALLDPSLSFVFLHMPIPHPPGIYDRHTGKLSIDHTSYIDNLALADKYLAHIREELQANGTWDDTSIVIMGDHSWRTNIEWNKTNLWMPEDEVASDGGKFDSRPGYIIKLAGQTTPAHIDAPFKAIRTRALLNALFQNQIATPQQLAAWAM